MELEAIKLVCEMCLKYRYESEDMLYIRRNVNYVRFVLDQHV